MGWPLPKNNLDLFIEYRDATNGRNLPQGNSLIGALILRHLDSIGSETKERMRDLILRGGPYADDEIAAILDYCESDVAALLRLLTVMLSTIDLPRAPARPVYERRRLHGACRHPGGCCDAERAENSPEGQREQTFRDAANDDPQLQPLYDLRVTLASMRASRLAVGVDGRNRFMISPFPSRMSRNQPSTTQSIFGPSTWLRSVMQPPEGHALIYFDWAQQEFGAAAALSNDPNTIEAYTSY